MSATNDQIEAAKDWTADYLNVLVSTGRAIAAEAVRLTVPPTHRVVSVDDLVLVLSLVPEERPSDSVQAAIGRLKAAVK